MRPVPNDTVNLDSDTVACHKQLNLDILILSVDYMKCCLGKEAIKSGALLFDTELPEA